DHRQYAPPVSGGIYAGRGGSAPLQHAIFDRLCTCPHGYPVRSVRIEGAAARGVGAMMLLWPAALWFGLAAPIIVALYLLKIRLRRQTVPALDFWRRIAGRVQVRSLFQRLKRWLSLLLWLAIAGCLVLALGNPLLTAGAVKPASIAVVLDNSASMQ